jgi:hypothetical protein
VRCFTARSEENKDRLENIQEDHEGIVKVPTNKVKEKFFNTAEEIYKDKKKLFYKLHHGRIKYRVLCQIWKYTRLPDDWREDIIVSNYKTRL